MPQLSLSAGRLMLTVLIPVAIVLWFATGVWVLYRIIRGWLALSSTKVLP